MAADARPRVLVVDDEEDIVFACRVNLEAEGFEVVAAHSGRRALEILRDRTVDVVLLDLSLPDMSGWDCLAAIKADPVLRGIPVLLFSAKLDDDETRTRAVQMGVEGLVAKPFHINELIDVVRAAAEP